MPTTQATTKAPEWSAWQYGVFGALSSLALAVLFAVVTRLNVSVLPMRGGGLHYVHHTPAALGWFFVAFDCLTAAWIGWHASPRWYCGFTPALGVVLTGAVFSLVTMGTLMGTMTLMVADGGRIVAILACIAVAALAGHALRRRQIGSGAAGNAANPYSP